MPPSPSKRLLIAGIAALALAIPAASQKPPEPSLPPGFGEPPPQAPPPEQQPAAPTQNGVAPAAAPAAGDSQTVATDVPVQDTAADDLQEVENVPAPPAIELPEYARRPVDLVGAIGPGERGLEANAFGAADGRFLSVLMRRLDAPLPSRWMSIALRQALVSRLQAPANVDPVDWVAERAWLLLRMGEADAARILVQAVDTDRFTPKMVQVAQQAALATSDPAGLCPLVAQGRTQSDEAAWPLADAMCAALSGDSAKAGALIDSARRRSGARGIDVTLAEKVVGAGPNARRAVTVQWDDADAISSWRYGLATATGLPIPERLMKPANPRVWSWEARAPMVPIEERVKPAQVAAALGVFSAESLVEIYSALGDSTDPADFASSLPGKLRGAYVGTFADRLGAMRGLWGNSKDPIDWYAQRILTATAAARLAPSDSAGKDVFDLVASMLAAGLDNEAAHWAATVGGMSGAEADRAWGLLAVGSPYGEAGTRRFDGFRGSDDSEAKQRSRFLFAALAGLGRIPEGSQAGMAEQLGVPIGREDAWSRMLDTATKAGQPGTVVLLSAVGMQTHDWSGVPPEHLYRIVRAMRQVGLEFDARMIAAEALSRV